MLTDNNPWAYVCTSCLGAAQICWLSDLKYRARKSNQVADALSQWPVNPESSSKSSDDDEKWETISYKMKLFDTISPSPMAEYQKRSTQLSYVYECVADKSKPKLSEIHCVRSKPICRLLL